jgi:hypothetical protein
MRLFRVTILAALTLSLIGAIWPMTPAVAQSTTANVKVGIVLPGGSGQQFDGLYLGHGLVLTTWRAATLYGLQNAGKVNTSLFVSPRHRLAHYVVPAPTDPQNPDYDALQYALCGDQWVISTDATAKGCLPFDLSSITTVEHGTETPLAVKRLLYADQATDVAVLETVSAPVNWTSEKLANTVTNAITAYAPWLNDIYGSFIIRDDTPFKAVLQEAVIAPTVGKPSLGDPTTPELGNTGYHVSHYDLDLHFNTSDTALKATATLDMLVAYPKLSGFYLDFSTLIASQITIDGVTAKFRQDAQTQKLLITPVQPLTYGQTVKVAIKYGGVLKDFQSRYMPFLPTGLFVDVASRRVFDVDEPDGAHSWFPCNDQPLDRATYTFHITVASDLTVVANGQQQGDPVNNTDGTHTFTWVMPHTMPTYLAVIAIANYEPTTLPDGPTGIPLTAYTYADDPSGAAFNVTGPIMKLEIARFGPFPFESYGQVVVPQDAVGMESQTMTVMFDGLPQSSPNTIYFFISHEMAHHWYGDSLTLSTWGDIWLNEGFASYAEYIAFSDSGNPYAATTLANWKRQVADTVNSQAITHLSVDNLFGTEAYEKAGYVLHMLREKIGDTAFFKLLQNYAARFAYGNTTTDRFWAMAEDISGQDLSAFFTQWLQQIDMPRVDVNWTEADGQISVLACPRTLTARAFNIDVPLVFNTVSEATPTPDSGTNNPANGESSAKIAVADQVAIGTDTEALHLTKSSGSLQFTPGFEARSLKIDPTNSVLVDARPIHVATLPTTCPAPVDTSK